MNSPRYAGAPPSLVVGGVCLLANFSTCREVGKLAGQGGGGTAGARRGKRTRRARAVVGVAGWCWVVAGQEAVLQGVGGLAALRGGAGSRGEEAGAGVVVYPGVREGNGSGTFSRVTASAEKEVAQRWDEV